MEENKQGKPKPSIDKEYLKKLAEKIKAEKARKEAMNQKKDEGTPPPPPMSSIPPTLLDDDDEDEDMAAEKTAIIDLASLSGQSADARMTIMDGKDEGKSIEITREETFAGRSLDNDFVISDISVSRKHFKIKREGDHYLAQDMGSGNGIRVNGNKSSSATLYNNDVIIAGARQIRFEILNEEMKEKYSRKDDMSAKGSDAPVKQKSSFVSWVAIFLVIAAAGAGYYLFTQQSKKIEQAAFKLGFEDIDKVDELIEKFEFKKAEKNVQFFLSQTKKASDQKLLNERLAIIKKEKAFEPKFNEGKVLFEQKKVAEAGKVLQQIPEDSAFYPEIKKLVGDETITSWKIEEIKGLITTKKEDEALKLIYALLLEQPDNADAKALQEQLTSKVGAEKAKDLQKKAEAEKKKKIAEAKERAKKKALAAKKRKARKAKRIATKKRSPKPKPKPKKTDSIKFGNGDINRAIDLYLSKDYDSAIELLDKISDSNSGAVSKKAALKKLNVIKFKRSWDKAQNTSGKKQKKYITKLIKYDKKISGGKMKGEIKSLKSADGSSDPFSDGGGSSDGGSMSNADAKKLYMKARSLRKENPDKARDVLQQIIDGAPKSSKYYKKAKKLLKKL